MKNPADYIKVHITWLVFLLGVSHVYAQTANSNKPPRSFSHQLSPSYADVICRTNAQTDPSITPQPQMDHNWQIIHHETFESELSDGWAAFDENTSNGLDYWGRSSCGNHTPDGNFAAWCATVGSMECGYYDNNMRAYLVYGPFTLEDAVSAVVEFYYINDSEGGYDSFGWAASIDGSSFHGYEVDGISPDYPGVWTHQLFDLAQTPTLGNLCGRAQVWIAFTFTSDSSANQYDGAFVDDVTIKKNIHDPRPDLEPYRPAGWDDTLVLATQPDTTNSDDAFYDHLPLYLDYCSINSGNIAAGPFTYGIWLDDVMIKEVILEDGLKAGFYSSVLDSELGTLTAGVHTLTIQCDPNNEIAEFNETNNSYTRQFEVQRLHGDIIGAVWNDINKNSVMEANEPGLAEWTVYLDLDGNCIWDNNEPATITDSQGRYTFSDLLPGTYSVAIVSQSRWQQTWPEDTTPSQPAMTYMRSSPSTYVDALSEKDKTSLIVTAMDSPPVKPLVIKPAAQSGPLPELDAQTAVMIEGVPTSTWTYGCSATAAGMIFGYYDRLGYPNMYTGPTNNGLAPLTDLGQGINDPIAGSCSIIATQNGFDGRPTPGHVDDYWSAVDNAGPDPWTSHDIEHIWSDCTADYMGTNQWKWDTNKNGNPDYNVDGSTLFFTYSDARKLHDLVPTANYGSPQTALCHGMRLFAESRGYVVLENYSQRIDTDINNGFSFADYMREIDEGQPVMIQLQGHSMVGVGYDPASETILVHDTWSNDVNSMIWGGEYAGMKHFAVTVLHLAAVKCPGIAEVTLAEGQTVENINFGNHGLDCGEWGYLPADTNRDCYVDLEDFNLLCEQWLKCTNPRDEQCELTE